MKKQGTAQIHKERTTCYPLFSYYLSDSKSNGETEAPRYKSDFIKFTA